MTRIRAKANKDFHSSTSDEFVAKPADPVDSNPYNETRSSSPDEVTGLVGLANLGNTCYMNSALQCLSNVPALTEFFLTCSSLVTKADIFNGVQRDKPSLSHAYFGLLRELWSSKAGNHSYVPPTKLLLAFKAAHPMFRGYHQQDTQEFLRCFMDQLHEELMEPFNELESQTNNADDLEANLESVSETESVSQDDEEDQEYETADSGVSEESNDQLLPPSRNGTRKRKHQGSLSRAGDSQRYQDSGTIYVKHL